MAKKNKKTKKKEYSSTIVFDDNFASITNLMG